MHTLHTHIHTQICYTHERDGVYLVTVYIFLHSFCCLDSAKLLPRISFSRRCCLFFIFLFLFSTRYYSTPAVVVLYSALCRSSTPNVVLSMPLTTDCKQKFSSKKKKMRSNFRVCRRRRFVLLCGVLLQIDFPHNNTHTRALPSPTVWYAIFRSPPPSLSSSPPPQPCAGSRNRFFRYFYTK